MPCKQNISVSNHPVANSGIWLGACSAPIWHSSPLLALEPCPKPQLPGLQPDNVPTSCQNTLSGELELVLVPFPRAAERGLASIRWPLRPHPHEALPAANALCPDTRLSHASASLIKYPRSSDSSSPSPWVSCSRFQAVLFRSQLGPILDPPLSPQTHCLKSFWKQVEASPFLEGNPWGGHGRGVGAGLWHSDMEGAESRRMQRAQRHHAAWEQTRLAGSTWPCYWGDTRNICPRATPLGDTQRKGPPQSHPLRQESPEKELKYFLSQRGLL